MTVRPLRIPQRRDRIDPRRARRRHSHRVAAEAFVYRRRCPATPIPTRPLSFESRRQWAAVHVPARFGPSERPTRAARPATRAPRSRASSHRRGVVRCTPQPDRRQSARAGRQEARCGAATRYREASDPSQIPPPPLDSRSPETDGGYREQPAPQHIVRASDVSVGTQKAAKAVARSTPAERRLGLCVQSWRSRPLRFSALTWSGCSPAHATVQPAHGGSLVTPRGREGEACICQKEAKCEV